MTKENFILLAIVIVGVILGGYIIGKFKLNSYEEYLEGPDAVLDARNEYRIAA